MKDLLNYAGESACYVAGSSLCAGCSAGIIANQVLSARKGRPVVLVLATGCLEVSSTMWPFGSYGKGINVLHVSFETAAGEARGVAGALASLRRRGKISSDAAETIILVLAGDGGTYDIGLQSLSGMLEGGQKITYVVYDNGAYQNTGVQASASTPKGAATTTTPFGAPRSGGARAKDILRVVAAHHPAYVAQSTPNTIFPQDLTRKAGLAFDAAGPSFLRVLSPCTLGWGFPTSQAVALGDLAIETGVLPLIEIVEGKWKLDHVPDPRRPITDYLKYQDRFRDALKDPNMVASLQREVDQEWELLLRECR